MRQRCIRSPGLPRSPATCEATPGNRPKTILLSFARHRRRWRAKESDPFPAKNPRQFSAVAVCMSSWRQFSFHQLFGADVPQPAARHCYHGATHVYPGKPAPCSLLSPAIPYRRTIFMHSSRNRWLLCTLVFVAALLLLGIYLKRAASAPKVAASFLNYTNTTGANNRQFVVVTFGNRERVPIQWHDVYVEEAGSSEHHAPVMNPGLPWITKPSLESGESEVLAVGKPNEQVRWRVCWDYSPAGSTNNYTATSKWFEP